MKIVIIGPVYPFRGGIAHHTTLLAKALRQATHDVNIISFKQQYPSWLYPGSSDRDPSSQPLSIDATYTLEPLAPWTWIRAAEDIIHQAPDLVIITWWTTFWAPAFTWLGARLRHAKIKQIYMIHNIYPHEQRFFDRFLVSLALRQGQGFLLQAENEREKLIKLIKKPVPIVDCPHPAYDFFIHRKLNKIEARQKLGIASDTPLLLFFGVVRPYKGLSILVEALSEIIRKGRCIHLIVAGEFWEDVQKYERMMDRLGVRNQVTIDNRYIPNEEVEIYFSAADLFVAPYINATQSGTIKIALAFRLPMVVTDILMDELLQKKGKIVQVVPAGDSLALAKAIETVLDQGSGDEAAEEQSVGEKDAWADMVRAVEQIEALTKTPQAEE
jgi:glycosyltransferase involved in cell wall biosynthesis